MLSVIPAGLFSRLRIFLGRLKPHALPVARRHIVLGSIGAGTGLAVTSMFSHWLLGEVNLWFIAPMGASAVLLFGVPSSPLAQPWSIVGGNVVSALIGVTVGMWVPQLALACGLAAGLAIAAMYFLRCLHPPGGAVALTAILGGAGVHSAGYHFVLTPVLLNSMMLALLAIIFNNLVGRRYPHPLAAEEVKGAPQDVVQPHPVAGGVRAAAELAQMVDDLHGPVHVAVDLPGHDGQHLVVDALASADLLHEKGAGGLDHRQGLVQLVRDARRTEGLSEECLEHVSPSRKRG